MHGSFIHTANGPLPRPLKTTTNTTPARQSQTTDNVITGEIVRKNYITIRTLPSIERMKTRHITIEEAIRTQLEKRKLELIKKGFETISNSCSDSFKWAVEREVQKQIGQLFETQEVKDLIQDLMVQTKESLKDSFATEIRKITPTIGASFAVALQNKIITKLQKDSYEIRDLFKNLLNYWAEKGKLPKVKLKEQ